jgi:secondary thiamine-phosphate synthase enzyme
MVTLCHVYADLLTLHTDERLQLVDITPRIEARVRRADVADGIVLATSMHTTLALFISESQDALLYDIRAFLTELVAPDREWRHNDPRFSDCDRRNADAHLRATILGHSVVLPVQNGRLVRGTFQAVIAAELDGPRTRTLNVQVLGS